MCDLNENRCFAGSFRKFSGRGAQYQACHAIWTLSPLEAALPMDPQKHTQHDTSRTLRPRRKMTQSIAPAGNTASHLRKTSQKYCASHAKALSTLCHVMMSGSAMPATQNYVTGRFKSLKVINAICSNRHRYGHSAPIANACGRLRMARRPRANTSPPQTPGSRRTLRYTFRKNR